MEQADGDFIGNFRFACQTIDGLKGSTIPNIENLVEEVEKLRFFTELSSRQTDSSAMSLLSVCKAC